MRFLLTFLAFLFIAYAPATSVHAAVDIDCSEMTPYECWKAERDALKEERRQRHESRRRGGNPVTTFTAEDDTEDGEPGSAGHGDGHGHHRPPVMPPHHGDGDRDTDDADQAEAEAKYDAVMNEMSAMHRELDQAAGMNAGSTSADDVNIPPKVKRLLKQAMSLKKKIEKKMERAKKAIARGHYRRALSLLESAQKDMQRLRELKKEILELLGRDECPAIAIDCQDGYTPRRLDDCEWTCEPDHIACPAVVQECSDGSTVGYSVINGDCVMGKCPEECPEIAVDCQDGHTPRRLDNCEWVCEPDIECPAFGPECPDGTILGYTVVNGECVIEEPCPSEPPVCPEIAKQCPDGSTVGYRVVNGDCVMEECPDDGDLTVADAKSAVANAAESVDAASERLKEVRYDSPEEARVLVSEAKEALVMAENQLAVLYQEKEWDPAELQAAIKEALAYANEAKEKADRALKLMNEEKPICNASARICDDGSTATVDDDCNQICPEDDDDDDVLDYDEEIEKADAAIEKANAKIKEAQTYVDQAKAKGLSDDIGEEELEEAKDIMTSKAEPTRDQAKQEQSAELAVQAREYAEKALALAEEALRKAKKALEEEEEYNDDSDDPSDWSPEKLQAEIDKQAAEVEATAQQAESSSGEKKNALMELLKTVLCPMLMKLMGMQSSSGTGGQSTGGSSGSSGSSGSGGGGDICSKLGGGS